MDNNLLNYLSGLYVQHDIQERYGYTFEKFIEAYESGAIDELLEVVT